jgi:hypothetical protein
MSVVGGLSLFFFVPLGSVRWVPGLVDRLFRPANWVWEAGSLPTLLLVGGMAAFVIVYVTLMRRLTRDSLSFQSLMDAGFLVSLMAFAFGMARSQPWHLIWPAALAGLSARRWAGPVVAVLSMVMLGAQVWVEWGVPGVGVVF